MPARKRGMIDARGNSAGAWETPARPSRQAWLVSTSPSNPGQPTAVLHATFGGLI